MAARHALVIGGSVGGLLIARLLLKLGWKVTVFEKSRSDLSSRGAGLGAQSELFAIMRRLDLPVDGSVALRLRSRASLAPDGQTICEVTLEEASTAWDIVYRLLREHLPEGIYRPAMRLTGLDMTLDGVAATFENGDREHADLLVGADGVQSTVRRQILPSVEPRYAGYVGWRGLVRHSDIPIAFRDELFGRMNFCFPDGEMALAVPVPGSRAGEQMRCQFSWFRPVEHSALDALRCAGGSRHGPSISPREIRPDVIRNLKLRARQILAPQLASLIERAERPLLQPILDLESPRLVHNRAVLLGDAAFVARPHVGTGVTKAALDAVALADAIALAGPDLDGALARYEREQLIAGRRIVARGRNLGAYLSEQLWPRDQRTAKGLNRVPDRYMREFGAGGEITKS